MMNFREIHSTKATLEKYPGISDSAMEAMRKNGQLAKTFAQTLCQIRSPSCRVVQMFPQRLICMCMMCPGLSHVLCGIVRLQFGRTSAKRLLRHQHNKPRLFSGKMEENAWHCVSESDWRRTRTRTRTWMPGWRK